jgi:hypothetical protein
LAYIAAKPVEKRMEKYAVSDMMLPPNLMAGKVRGLQAVPV